MWWISGCLQAADLLYVGPYVFVTKNGGCAVLALARRYRGEGLALGGRVVLLFLLCL